MKARRASKVDAEEARRRIMAVGKRIRDRWVVEMAFAVPSAATAVRPGAKPRPVHAA
jgi:hypothetical protein